MHPILELLKGRVLNVSLRGLSRRIVKSSGKHDQRHHMKSAMLLSPIQVVCSSCSKNRKAERQQGMKEAQRR